MTAFLGVHQRVVIQVDADHVLTSRLHRLLNCDRHLTRLAIAESNLASTITDNGECSETKLTAALYYFGDAVNGDQFFNEVIAWLIVIVSCHFICLSKTSVRLREPHQPVLLHDRGNGNRIDRTQRCRCQPLSLFLRCAHLQLLLLRRCRHS